MYLDIVLPLNEIQLETYISLQDSRERWSSVGLGKVACEMLLYKAGVSSIEGCAQWNQEGFLSSQSPK